jgi:hypothetical protein
MDRLWEVTNYWRDRALKAEAELESLDGTGVAKNTIDAMAPWENHREAKRMPDYTPDTLDFD